jgi:hypothetical protein
MRRAQQHGLTTLHYPGQLTIKLCDIKHAHSSMTQGGRAPWDDTAVPLEVHGGDGQVGSIGRHAVQVRRPVKTASADQVRRPHVLAPVHRAAAARPSRR